jgi:hypothetical protein
MKGLFCCLPTEEFYHFSVYGLKDQQVFANTSRKLSSRYQSKFIDYSSIHPLHPDQIFSSYWLFARQEPLLPLPTELHSIHQNAGQYAKRKAESPTNSSSPRPIFRFSKYSMISSLNTYSPEQLENGVILALCRVLIIKQKTITTLISDEDIQEALEGGYDAVFSSFK